VNGFYFYVKRSEVIELDMSTDEALKYIISMGVVTTDNSAKDRKGIEAHPAPQGMTPAAHPRAANE
jgi:uncharacterized membrane protein